MVEIMSWIAVVLIGLGALVGFTGVVTTTLLLGVRRLGRRQSARPVTPGPLAHAG